MSHAADEQHATPVAFTLDGHELTAHAGESILDAALRHGFDIPHLCHQPGLRPAGNCRACLVEIDGERALAASCCRAPAPGMSVHAGSGRARRSRDMVLELLLAEMPESGHRWLDADGTLPHGELSAAAARAGVHVRPQWSSVRRPPPADGSHPAMIVNLDACIQCTRCVRACRETQVNDVIG